MEIRVEKFQKNVWSIELVASNGTVLMSGMRNYASRRNAVAAAELIAKGKLKVVVK